MKGPIPVWQMVREAATAINKASIESSEIKGYIKAKYGAVNEFTIDCQIKICCVNFYGRTNWPVNQKPRTADGKYDFLFFLSAGKVTLYNPEIHGQWMIVATDGRLEVRRINEKIEHQPITDKMPVLVPDYHSASRRDKRTDIPRPTPEHTAAERWQ